MSNHITTSGRLWFIRVGIFSYVLFLCFTSMAQVVLPPNTLNQQPDPQTTNITPYAPGHLPSGLQMTPPSGSSQPQMALSEMLGEAQLIPHRSIDRLPPLWPYYLTIGLLALGILLALIIFIVRKNRRPKPESFIPSDIRALSALEMIRPLIQEAKARDFSYQASEIIRTYIEERFGIKARNRTTREFLQLAIHPDSTIPAQHEPELDEFLHYCDLAKFAKQVMQPSQLDSMFKIAAQFIKDTRPSIMATSSLVTESAKMQESET